MTPKRRQILEAMQGRTDHPTAEDLYHALRARGSGTSLATVYRALRALAASGLVGEVHGPGPDRFDPVQEPHYHFVCTTCNRVYDAGIPYQEQLNRLPHPAGFRVLGHEVTFFGVCPSCSGATEGDHGQGS